MLPNHTPFLKSLNAQLLWSLTVIALISIAALGIAAYYNQETALEAQVKAQLTSVADLKKEQIVSWLAERQADVRLLAVNKLNQDHLTQILSPEITPARQTEMATFLTDNLIGLQQSRVGYREIAFVDPQGTVIIATNPAVVGQDTVHQVVFAETLAATDGVFIQDIHRDPITNLTEMAFGHVVRQVDLETGAELDEIIGVVYIIVNINETIYPLIEAWPGMGETGETLLIRAEGENTLFLNNLRFDPNAALNLRLAANQTHAEPAHRSSRGDEGVIQAADYRGVPVLAAYRHIPGINWGFVAKEDLDQIFAPVHVFARRIGWMAVGVFVVAGFLSLLISRTLTRPIAKLVAGTDAVAAGDLTVEIEVNRRDEVGLLARSFNQMTKQLSQSQAGLKQYVGELEQTQLALAQSELRLRSIYDGVNDAILLVNPHTNCIVETNSRATEMLGYEAVELIGLSIQKIHPNDMPLLSQLVESILQNGSEQSNELTCFTKDQRMIPVEISFSAVEIEGEPYILAAARDVTQRKQLEIQLRQSQKMEAIGRLAGGIAHDFNNLLTVITGYSKLLLHRHLDENSPLREELEQIDRAGERAAILTRQLLTFSRKQLLQPEIFQLNDTVSDIEKMLRRLIGEDIVLTTILTSEVTQIKADRGQMEQVIMNLAVNARDAMPRGGHLTLETAIVHLDEAHIQQHIGLETTEPYVKLTVRDTGIGMDEQTLSHIFEPFFTTKGQDKGTGLGLATVHGIVAQSHGHIQVKSKPGHGTTFKICLPAVGRLDILSEQKQEIGPTTGSETILLVEDETEVRQLVDKVLQQSGYTVLAATNGPEALALYQHYEYPIDLLLTDVVMPGELSGPDLVKQLLRQQPAMKVMLMSGYTNGEVGQADILNSELAYIQKPFQPERLTHKIRQVLDN